MVDEEVHEHRNNNGENQHTIYVRLEIGPVPKMAQLEICNGKYETM